jgi:nucleoside-diphosphate-sugar epimerase
MVVGNGLIAKSFGLYKDKNDYLIFASGVSDSTNTAISEFNRERDLLRQKIKENPDKTIIYFSTCSIYDPHMNNSPYVQHKLAMENILATAADNFHIFRISNLAGKTTNPHTVLNYFIQHISQGIFFNLWKGASRNIIDIDDVLPVCNYIIEQKLYSNQIINIANPVNYPVADIVQVIETISGKKGNYAFTDRISVPNINISLIKNIIEKLSINFGNDYLIKTIEKYFFADDVQTGPEKIEN